MNNHSQVRFDVVTVTLSPAIDRYLTIENFQAGAVHRVERVREHPAGKGVNVAAALSEYGMRVAATGLLGRDNAASFERLFEAQRIADCFVRIPGHTRVCIKVSDPARQQTTDINFAGLAPEPDALRSLESALVALEARCFVLAGSLPESVPADFYRPLVAALKAKGARVLVDTSGPALREVVEEKPHIIKPNRQELEALLGASLPTEPAVLEAARELVQSGIELVVVSLGALGACFVDAQQAVLARPPSLRTDSTVGAGDAMVAGLVAGELAAYPLHERARLATAFSIAALTHSGRRESSRSAIHGALSQVLVS